MGLSSEAARRELTKRTLLELQEEERAHFAETVQRIKDNLSVQRDAKDLEIYNKATAAGHRCWWGRVGDSAQPARGRGRVGSSSPDQGPRSPRRAKWV